MSLDINLVMFNESVFSWNITHNLNVMAKEAGIYNEVWRPEEHEIYFAEQMIEPLQRGLKAIKDSPKKFRDLEPSNGWGDLTGFIKFLAEYLNECKRNPLAIVDAWR